MAIDANKFYSTPMGTSKVSDSVVPITPVSDDALAAKLYGATTPSGQKAPTHNARTGLNAMYPGQPATPAPIAAPTSLPKPEDKIAEALFGKDAPQEYETFQIPLGFEHLVPDAAKHAEFTAYARENKLSQAQAQALVNLHVRTAFVPMKK